MKFKSNVEIQAGLEDNNATPGTSGQVLSSTGLGVEWINQSALTETQSNFVYFNVKNETGSTINKGKGVMAVGTDGNSGHILIDEMIADGSIESKYFLGVLETTVANGGFARVISFGQLDQFNTTGQNGETWLDGQVLWCDPNSAGDFTITEPDGPNVKIAAAIILNASVNGKIQVRVQANEGIHDLHDTKITSQVDGDVLVWDNTTGVWFNDSTLNVDYTNSRVGIGTTSPSHKLDVRGSGYFLGDTSVPNAPTDLGFYLGKSQTDENRRLEIVSPANGVSYIDFTKPSTDYRGRIAYYDNGDSFRFYTAATEKLRIDSSGNVGIGTTSPNNILHLGGNNNKSIRIDTALSNSAFFTGWQDGAAIGVNRNPANGTFTDTAKAASAIFLLGQASSSYITFNTTNANNTNPTERIRIDGDGNVGIGTTSPFTTGGTAKLTIASNSAISWGASNTDMSYFRRLTAGEFQWQTYNSGNTGEIHLQPYGGNVGIGTTSPDSKLEIEGSSSSDKIIITNPLSSSLFTAGLELRRTTVLGGAKIESKRNAATGGVGLEFLTTENNAAEVSGTYSSRMVILENGNIGIGTTTPGAKLDVNGNAFLNTVASIQGVDTGNPTAVTDELRVSGYGIMGNRSQGLYFTNSNSGGSIFFGSGGAHATGIKMTVGSNGNVGIGTTSPSTALHIARAASTAPIIRLQTTDSTTNGNIQWTNSANSILVRIGSNMAVGDSGGNLEFQTGGTNSRMLITSSGNVGIGTTSPESILHISNDWDGSSNGQLTISGKTNSSKRLRLGFNTTANVGTIQATWVGTADQILALNPNGGNVGIGTTSPSQKLEVSTTEHTVGKFTGNTDNGTGYVGAVIEIESNSNSRGRGVYLTHRDSTDTTASEWYAGLPYTGAGYTIGNAAWGTSVNSDTGPADLAQSKFFIKKDGNVGIGTTSPSYKLDVNGSLHSTSLTIADAIYHEGDTNTYIQFPTNDAIRWVTNGGERMRLDSAGGLGIGTSTITSGRLLDVNGNALVRSNLYIGPSGGSAGAYSLEIGQNRSGNGFAFIDLSGDATYGGDFSLRIIRGNTGANATSQIIHRGTGNFSIDTLENANIILNPGSGNVGIGTTNPGAKLDVSGDINGTNVYSNKLFTNIEESVANITSYSASSSTIFLPVDGIYADSSYIQVDDFSNAALPTFTVGDQVVIKNSNDSSEVIMQLVYDEYLISDPYSLYSNATVVSGTQSGDYLYELGSISSTTVINIDTDLTTMLSAGNYIILGGIEYLISAITPNSITINASVENIQFINTVGLSTDFAMVSYKSTLSNGIAVQETPVLGFNIQKNKTFLKGGIDFFSSDTNQFIGKDSGASSVSEATFNTTSGYRTLYNNTTGSYNSAFGYEALNSNTTGSFNVALGYQTLLSNTIGSENVALGRDSSRSNVTGSRNISIGTLSMGQNDSGSGNVAIGTSSLYWNTSGNNNVGLGDDSFTSNRFGSDNVGIGYRAAYGSGNTVNNSVFVGSNTKPQGSNQSNQIVIGYDTTGNGSNTVTIGNSLITNNYFNGAVNSNSFKVKALNVAPATSTSAGITGEIRYTSDYIYVCVATNTWKRTLLSTW